MYKVEVGVGAGGRKSRIKNVADLHDVPYISTHGAN